MSKYKLKVLLAQLSLVIIAILSWQICANLGLINTFIFSSPSKILITIYSLLNNGELFSHLMVTLTEILLSFGLGITIALILSVLMYLYRFFGDILDPFLTMFNSLPKVALGPIIIIWMGANTNSIITMALLINVIVSIINIYTGFIHTDENKIKMFKTFKASKLQILTKLVIPSNIPIIISTLKVNLSLTFIGVIMGEFLVSKKGIGYLILYGTQVFNLNLVLAGIFILLITSYFIYLIITSIEKRLLY